MVHYFYSKETVVAMVLIAATIASFIIAKTSDSEAGELRWGGEIMLIFAFIKVWLVLQYFMEVKGAHWALRILVTSWALVAGSVVTFIYQM